MLPKFAVVMLLLSACMTASPLVREDVAQVEQSFNLETYKYSRDVEVVRQFLYSSRHINDSLATRYALAIVEQARENQVSPIILVAIVMQESNGDSSAVSYAGAVGLMQIMPNIWRGVFPECGDNLLVPETNICYGAHIYALYLRAEDNSPKQALRRYSGDKTHTYSSGVLMRTGQACLLQSDYED